MENSGSLYLINTAEMPEDQLITPQKYPDSVTELSNMLVHAHKDSIPLPPSSPRVSGPGGRSASTRLFKKSHTCGSFFANCGCKDVADTLDAIQFSQDKRDSGSGIENFFHSDNKRLSNPEISAGKVPQSCYKPKLQKCTQKPIYTANIYLNHPEINFPIPVELKKKDCDKPVPKQSKSLPSNLCPDLKNKLDYHKYTALSYESYHLTQKQEEAQKFLQDFGILTPMGNGASLKKNSLGSIDDETIQQIRKNSRTRDLRKRNSISLEEYEHMKAVNDRLQKDLADLEVKHETICKDQACLRKELNAKDNTILKLQREVHKLKVSHNCHLLLIILVIILFTFIIYS